MTHKDTENSVDYLLQVMKQLRAPDGCPWDAEQTPESLAPYILEEACELIDAIEDGNDELIRDELGDLLLQVVFQAQIFTEHDIFDFHDVATGIADKLVRRHPHVFDRQSVARPADELDRQWDEIKQSEANNNRRCLADHLPAKLPALQRAQKLVAKVYRSDRVNELPQPLPSSLIDTFDALQQEKITLNEELLGTILFELSRMAHQSGLDAESALRKKTRKILAELDGE